MAIKSEPNTFFSIISALACSKLFTFTLMGSRYIGDHTASSDFDFYTEERFDKRLHEFLTELGFVETDEGYSDFDANTLSVYKVQPPYSHKIEVILVADGKLQEIAWRMLKNEYEKALADPSVLMEELFDGSTRKKRRGRDFWDIQYAKAREIQHAEASQVVPKTEWKNVTDGTKSMNKIETIKKAITTKRPLWYVDDETGKIFEVTVVKDHGLIFDCIICEDDSVTIKAFVTELNFTELEAVENALGVNGAHTERLKDRLDHLIKSGAKP